MRCLSYSAGPALLTPYNNISSLNLGCLLFELNRKDPNIGKGFEMVVETTLMKKTFFLLFALAVFSDQSFSQTFRLQGGVNLANISITGDGDVADNNMLTSFQAGFIGDFKVAGPLFIQSGLVFSGKGSKTESGNENSATYYRASSNPKYIELPLNLVLKTPSAGGTRFFVGAGPYIAVGVGGRNKVHGRIVGSNFESEGGIEFSNDDPGTLDYEEGAGYGILKRFDYGLNGQVGLEGKSFVLSAGYGLGLAKIRSGASNDDESNKHRVISFTLGFKL